MTRVTESEQGWSEFWSEAARNMARGWSWSGFERSAFFINTRGAAPGPPAFTDLGPVLGADQVSDGRGLAAGDLDGDGDLDLVGTCSGTTPSVYVLRNDLPNERHFALVDVVPSERRSAAGTKLLLQSGGRTLRRDVVVGSGFLTQHALTQHFGLGSSDSIDRLEITWPDGEVQVRAAPPVDSRAVYRQDAEGFETLALARHNYNATGRLPAVEWDSEWRNLRVVPTPRPDLSQWQLTDLEGAPVPLVVGDAGRVKGGPAVLLNFWATWCGNCKAEMPELIEAHAKRRAGLRVVGISVDEEASDADVAATAERWGMPFPVTHPDADTRAALLEHLAPILGGGEGLTLPTSLLLSAGGRVLAIAEGAIEIDSLALFLEAHRADERSNRTRPPTAAPAGAPGAGSR